MSDGGSSRRARTSRDQYGPLAAAYGRSSYHANGPDLDPLLEATELTGRETVLDLGCGAGHVAMRLAPRSRRVLALDPTKAMLRETGRLAGERGVSNLLLTQAQAEQIPLGSASVDRIASRQSAHHWLDPRAALREIARVLRPGGLFVLVDTFAPEDPELDAFLNHVELLRDPSHVRDYRVSEWIEAFSEVGLRVEARNAWELQIVFEPWVTRSRTSEERRAELRGTLDGASERVRGHFHVAADAGFRLPYGLLAGRLERSATE